MAPSILRDAPRSWSGSRDSEGHREFNIKWRVKCLTTEGPATVMFTPGLPLPGTFWEFDDDIDFWAFCHPDMTITPEAPEGDPNEFFDIEQKFSTRPPPGSRCQDTNIEDPLLEPHKISGSFIKYSQEAATDKDGNAILNSAHERIRGPQVEFDANRPQVRVEQNVPELELDLLASMVDTVNEDVLWEFQPRTIKLSDVSWEEKYYGSCFRYFTRVLVFDVNPDGWDRRVLDEGTKVLNGHWDKDTGKWTLDNIAGAAPNPANPAHFKRAIDREGNLVRLILDGAGKPYDPSVPGSTPGYITVRKYDESNFLLLDIPVAIGP